MIFTHNNQYLHSSLWCLIKPFPVLFKLLNSQGLADNTVIAKVNHQVWDLDRPLEGDCSLQLLKFDDEEAQAVSPICPFYLI